MKMMTMKNDRIAIISAVDDRYGIGKNGEIPWHYKADFQFFKTMTLNSVCIMGRTTYEEIASKRKGKNSLLPKRECIVLSRNHSSSPLQGKAIKASNYEEALNVWQESFPQKPLFILGGRSLYEEAIEKNAKEAYITEIPSTYRCNTFFPQDLFQKYFNLHSSLKQNGLVFSKYTRSD